MLSLWTGMLHLSKIHPQTNQVVRDNPRPIRGLGVKPYIAGAELRGSDGLRLQPGPI